MTTAMLVAQAGLAGTIGHWLIIGLVVAAIIGIAYIVLRQTGVAVPPWAIQILWIVVAVFVGVIAIRFLLSAL